MSQPLVSVIIRTCQRPNVLKKALDSIQEQTYTNIEIVVVEDGANTAEKMLASEYKHLNYIYYSTGERLGRTKVGNKGLSLAHGEYFNFLDDDDRFLPTHIATLVNRLNDSVELAAYALAEERQIKYEKKNLENPRVKRKLVRYPWPYNRLLLYYMNYFPIQSVMFSRRLYEQQGGFDEEMDVMEDWDLWVRYSLCTDFLYVPEVTSIYFTPYKGKEKRKRDIAMNRSEKDVVKKYANYPTNLSVEQVNQDMYYILNVFNKKGILFYMMKIRNFLLYRDR